jgi:hypothetical protein
LYPLDGLSILGLNVIVPGLHVLDEASAHVPGLDLRPELMRIPRLPTLDTLDTCVP